MIKLKTLLQEIIVVPRRILTSLEIYQATLNQDITWPTETGPYSLPAEFVVLVVKLNDRMYYLANILSHIPDDLYPNIEVYVIPAQYLKNITPNHDLAGRHDEVLADVNNTIVRGKHIVARPSKS